MRVGSGKRLIEQEPGVESLIAITLRYTWADLAKSIEEILAVEEMIAVSKRVTLK